MAVAQNEARPHITLAEAMEQEETESSMALDEMLHKLRIEVRRMLDGVAELGVDFRGTVSATVGFRYNERTDRWQFAFKVSEPVYKSVPSDPAVDLDIPFQSVNEAQMVLGL